MVQRQADVRAGAATGDDAGMWRHVIGERSTAVGKLARVRAPRGVRLRQQPAAGAADDGAIAPFDELVRVERRTDHGWCWVVGMESMAGRTGFCEEQFLSFDPPEPMAHLHRVEPGERLADIAVRHYGTDLRDKNQVRLYVQALYLANKDHAGVYLDDVDLGLDEMVGRGRAEIETVETYKGAKVRAGLAIWLPSKAFIAQMKAAGMVTDGATAFSSARRAVIAIAEGVVDAAAYPAGFVVGLLHGAWNAIADLFVGAADMIEAVAKVAYHVITANPLAIKDMLMGWVDKLAAAWANRDKLADEFMRKWEADDGWDRGTFRGEVLGWVMMTALIAILTVGEGAAVMMTGRWAHVLRALETLDALGDVTTYARKVGRLPARAIDHVEHKLGRSATRADRAATHAAGDAADASRAAGEGAEGVGGDSHAAAGASKPALTNTTESLDWHTFHNDIRKMSPRARHVIRQLEKRGWVRIDQIAPEDLVHVSRWFGREIAVVQSPYGRLRVVLGTRDGIAYEAIEEGEAFVVHTHPVVRSNVDHFGLDLPNAGKHTEAVIDWSGQVTYYNKTGIKNAALPDGTLEPLRDYQAAFLDANGDIVGFARVDIVDGPQGATIKVIE